MFLSQGGILAPLGCRVIIEEVRQDEKNAFQKTANEKETLPTMDNEKDFVKVSEKLVDVSE